MRELPLSPELDFRRHLKCRLCIRRAALLLAACFSLQPAGPLTTTGLARGCRRRRRRTIWSAADRPESIPAEWGPPLALATTRSRTWIVLVFVLVLVVAVVISLLLFSKAVVSELADEGYLNGGHGGE